MKIQVLESFLSFFLLLHWARQLFLGMPPFISDPGSLCLFLLFCESLACMNNIVEIENKGVLMPSSCTFYAIDDVTVFSIPPCS